MSALCRYVDGHFSRCLAQNTLVKQLVLAIVLLVEMNLVGCRQLESSQHLASSPLPDKDYGIRGFNIVNPSPVPLDRTIREVVHNYQRSGPETRAAIRASLDNMDPFTLRDFAMRAAVFAIRERKRDWIADGLAAYAMNNDADNAHLFRYALALHHHAARRIGVDPGPLFEKAADAAQPGVATVIRRFADMDDSRKSIDKFFMEELPTGFIWRGNDPFTPKHDLIRAIIDIAAILDRDRYDAVGVSIRTSFPETWVHGAEAELRTGRGVASVQTEQSLNVYLVEVVDDRTAASLLHAWQKESVTAARPTLGIARGNLFCLVISMDPDEMHETPHTLQRFAAQLEGVLDAALRAPG